MFSMKKQRDGVKSSRMLLPLEGSDTVNAIFTGLTDDEQGVASFIKRSTPSSYKN